MNIVSSRGHFVALVGPDGVGKSSLAAELVQQYEGCTAYVHFRPPFWSQLPAAPSGGSLVPKAEVGGPALLGVLRIFKSLILFWAGYLRRVRPTIRRGCLVVADRWAYGYIAQPWSLGFGGPEWLARLVVRAIPSPEMTVLLEAPVETVLERKSELSRQQISEELARYSTIPSKRLVRVDATQSPGDMAREVLTILGEAAI